MAKRKSKKKGGHMDEEVLLAVGLGVLLLLIAMGTTLLGNCGCEGSESNVISCASKNKGKGKGLLGGWRPLHRLGLEPSCP